MIAVIPILLYLMVVIQCGVGSAGPEALAPTEDGSEGAKDGYTARLLRKPSLSLFDVACRLSNDLERSNSALSYLSPSANLERRSDSDSWVTPSRSERSVRRRLQFGDPCPQIGRAHV